MLDLSQLKAEVERATTLDAGMIALADELEANKGDPAAVQEIADALRSTNDSIAARLVKNTPNA